MRDGSRRVSLLACPAAVPSGHGTSPPLLCGEEVFCAMVVATKQPLGPGLRRSLCRLNFAAPIATSCSAWATTRPEGKRSAPHAGQFCPSRRRRLSTPPIPFHHRRSPQRPLLLRLPACRLRQESSSSATSFTARGPSSRDNRGCASARGSPSWRWCGASTSRTLLSTAL